MDNPPIVRKVSRAALFLLPLLLLTACSEGGGAGVSQTPAGSPPATLDEIRSVVPSGWSLDEWAVSPDGAYVALQMTGPERNPGARATVVSLYRRDTALVEIARVPGETLAVGGTEDILMPDDSGTRRLSLKQNPATATGQSVTVSVEASGKVTVSQDRKPPDPSWPQVIEGSEAADPLALLEVTPSARGGGPTWPPVPSESEKVTVPAGTVPVGWTVSQAIWSRGREYLAIVTAFASDTQLSIYRVGQGQLRELWRDVNAFVTLDEALAFQDVNGDGNLDIVYNTSNGGNGWTSWPTLAASLTADGRVEDLSFQLPIYESAATEPVDLDGDGVYEWLAIDASWQPSPFGHADSPSSTFVLAWDGHEYADATQRYPEAIDDARLKILSQSGGSSQLDPQPPAAGADCREKRLYLRDSVDRYLDYFDSRRQDDADRILAGLREYPSFGNLSAARDWVVKTLAGNPRHLSQPGEFFVCPQ